MWLNNSHQLTLTIILSAALAWCALAAYAENIDPDNDNSQFAYGENVGWLNFEPAYGPGVTVTETKLIGYVWAENIGWINLSPITYGGVVNNGLGHLDGFAWGENVGWINFNPQVAGDPAHYGVNIDGAGNFRGWAWGENVGWIHLQSSLPVAYQVKVCMVTLVDLAEFAHQWLKSGDVPGNFDWNDNPSPDNYVNLGDYSILASSWLGFCPDDWPW